MIQNSMILNQSPIQPYLLQCCCPECFEMKKTETDYEQRRGRAHAAELGTTFVNKQK